MRQLSSKMKIINGAVTRSYRYKVYLWDTLSTDAPTMQQIVVGTADLSYRREVASQVAGSIRISSPGDKRAGQLSMSLVAPDDRYNPIGGSLARFIREGCVIRVLEGDEAVDEDEWVYTFTGHLRGQAGFRISRENIDRTTQITAYSREASPKYSQMPFISQTYPRYTDYGFVIVDILSTVMGLRPQEYSRIDTALGRVTQFVSSSIVDLTPLEAINKVLEVFGMYAEFDGEGILRYVDKNMSRSVDKAYQGTQLIDSIGIPQSQSTTYNSVSIVGLDKNITETEHPNEDLASAQVVAGFWRPRETVFVQWSKDRSVRAKDTVLEIQRSIADSLLFSGFGSEVYEELDDYSGRISVDITGYVGTMLALIGISLAAKAALGDIAPPFGGLTIPIGKIAEAVVIQLIVRTIATISTGQYTVRGTILIPVFEQISVVLTAPNTPDFLVNQREIRNDWLNEEEELLEMAEREMMYDSAQSRPFELGVINDLEIEIGDILYIDYQGGLRFWIDSWSKTISRDEMPIMRLNGYRAL